MDHEHQVSCPSQFSNHCTSVPSTQHYGFPGFFFCQFLASRGHVLSLETPQVKVVVVLLSTMAKVVTSRAAATLPGSSKLKRRGDGEGAPQVGGVVA